MAVSEVKTIPAEFCALARNRLKRILSPSERPETLPVTLSIKAIAAVGLACDRLSATKKVFELPYLLHDANPKTIAKIDNIHIGTLLFIDASYI